MTKAINAFNSLPFLIKMIMGLIGFIAAIAISIASYTFTVKADNVYVKTEVKRVEDVAAEKIESVKCSQETFEKRLDKFGDKLDKFGDKINDLPDKIYKRLKEK